MQNSPPALSFLPRLFVFWESLSQLWLLPYKLAPNCHLNPKQRHNLTQQYRVTGGRSRGSTSGKVYAMTSMLKFSERLEPVINQVRINSEAVDERVLG